MFIIQSVQYEKINHKLRDNQLSLMKKEKQQILTFKRLKQVISPRVITINNQYCLQSISVNLLID